MPYGKYKGVKLANVPGSYLIWLSENISEKSKLRWSLNDKMMMVYIDDNKDIINKENR